MFLSVLPLTAQNTLANSCHSLQYTDGSEGVKMPAEMQITGF